MSPTTAEDCAVRLTAVAPFSSGSWSVGASGWVEVLSAPAFVAELLSPAAGWLTVGAGCDDGSTGATCACVCWIGVDEPAIKTGGALDQESKKTKCPLASLR